MARFEADESCCCGARITCASNDLAASTMVSHRLEDFRKAHAVCRERPAGGTVDFDFSGQSFDAAGLKLGGSD